MKIENSVALVTSGNRGIDIVAAGLNAMAIEVRAFLSRELKTLKHGTARMPAAPVISTSR